MMVGEEVVCEVLSDNEVILYQPVNFSSDEAANYMSRYALMESRHFFVANLELVAP